MFSFVDTIAFELDLDQLLGCSEGCPLEMEWMGKVWCLTSSLNSVRELIRKVNTVPHSDLIIQKL